MNATRKPAAKTGAVRSAELAVDAGFRMIEEYGLTLTAHSRPVVRLAMIEAFTRGVDYVLGMVDEK